MHFFYHIIQWEENENYYIFEEIFKSLAEDIFWGHILSWTFPIIPDFSPWIKVWGPNLVIFWKSMKIWMQTDERPEKYVSQVASTYQTQPLSSIEHCGRSKLRKKLYTWLCAVLKALKVKARKKAATFWDFHSTHATLPQHLLRHDQCNSEQLEQFRQCTQQTDAHKNQTNEAFEVLFDGLSPLLMISKFAFSWSTKSLPRSWILREETFSSPESPTTFTFSRFILWCRSRF